jgi:hypothetical protein
MSQKQRSQKVWYGKKAKGMPAFHVYPIPLISKGFYFIRFIKEVSF